MVVSGPEGVTFKMRRKIITRDEARVHANFFERGSGREKDPMRLWAAQKFPGRRSTAGGTLCGPQAPAGLGRGSATRDSALHPVVRAPGLTRTKFDNFFTRRGRARLAKRRLLCAGT